MLTILLLAVATAAAGTCARLGFVNIRLRRINRELHHRCYQSNKVNSVLRSRIEVLKAEANLVRAIAEYGTVKTIKSNR